MSLVVEGRLALLSVLLVGCAAPVREPARFTVWAWGSKQDLRFLPADVEVAALAAELQLDGEALTVHRRTQPLLLSPGTRPIAVVRLETHGHGVSAGAMPRLVDVLEERMTAFHAQALQLDYDVVFSERQDALRLLRAVRERLGTRHLSITGLASWCTEQPPWFRAAPIDEVVPQLFRMGADATVWRTRFAQGALSGCDDSVGVSTDEVHGPVPGARHVFVFHPGAWSAEAFSEVQSAWR